MSWQKKKKKKAGEKGSKEQGAQEYKGMETVHNPSRKVSGNNG